MSRAQRHPTGMTAMVATVFVWSLSLVGVDMPAEVGASIVGIAAVLVSSRTPR